MNRVDQLAPIVKDRPRKPKLSRPFVAVELNVNPWALPRMYQDCIAITYGNINHLARLLTSSIAPETRPRYLQRRQIKRYPDGRAFCIKLRVKRDVHTGGNIWIRDSQGRTVTIFDVKSLFQLQWKAVQKIYGSNDLAGIMESTRSSLAAVGLKAAASAWDRCSSITDYLWKKLEIDHRAARCTSVRRYEPGNLQGYNVFGHTDEPVYFYDIHSAYLAEMAKFPTFKPFTDFLWGARQELRQANDPAEILIKLAGTIMPGKFLSTLEGNRFYRPVLGRFISQQVNDRLRKAMSYVDYEHNRFRWCVDGFISPCDISKHLDIGLNLGQWKPVEVQPYLTIAQTNIWWTPTARKNNGYAISEQQVLADPTEITTFRDIFSWETLEISPQSVTIRNNHWPEYCFYCQNDIEGLHQKLPKTLVPFREND